MGPNITSTPTGVLFENELEINPQTQLTTETKNKKIFIRVIVWRNVLAFVILHLAALYGLYRALTSAKLLTTLFGKINHYLYLNTNNIDYLYIYLFIIIIIFQHIVYTYVVD